ncbi:MAG: sortase [Ardenticatenaceae bacterium]
MMRFLVRFLTLVGLGLILLGGVMWWRQSRLEAALLSQEERVLLAVTAEPATPAILPESPARSTEEAAPEGMAEPSATPPQMVLVEARPTDEIASLSQPTEAPAPTATVAPPPTADPFPPAATLPTRIVAPAIHLDAPVVEMGWDVKTDTNGNQYSEWVVPSFAAGWHKNSVLPGHGGNTVLSGHHNINGEVFRYLVNLEPGNEVLLEAGEAAYRYIVEEKYIVKEKGEPIEVRRENNRFIEPTPDERLTLVTCWPYETNTHRVVVIARPAP